MGKLASLRKYLVFGAASGLLLIMACSDGFGQEVAGTYVVTRDPADGASRILTIHEDGTLSSINSTQHSATQFSATPSGFSAQNGAWEKVGEHKVQALVLNTNYDISSGAPTGFAIARYDLVFDDDFQIVEGEVSGEVFEPGVDVLNPGNAVPILTFTDEFVAKRVMIK